MPIRKSFRLANFLLLASVIFTAPVQAFDPDKKASDSEKRAFDPETTFKGDEKPSVILKFGMTALKHGNMEDAIGAFRFGAKKNDLASQWKLARMLQSGEGLPKDDLAAYKLYSKIANRYSDRAAGRRDRAFVSNAFVNLGRYSLTGIKGTPVKADPRRAESYFYRAAALYKSPEAQYQLGKLYRSEQLGTKQPRSAVRWFGLASRKGHARALAELGEMVYYGEGVRRRPVRGMVLMTRAAAKSGARNSLNSISKMRKNAFKKASQAQRAAAEKIISGLNLKPKPSADRSFGFTVESRSISSFDTVSPESD